MANNAHLVTDISPNIRGRVPNQAGCRKRMRRAIDIARTPVG
ncbi:hypothetical protein [Mangrovactinospora gilvigrisea]|nr:hypothetical protein [Mangrovactinospora gilvigrisea]